MNKLIQVFVLFLSLMIISPLWAYSGNNKVPDEELTFVVKEKISTNSALADYSIDVSTHDGIVTLSGEVNTEDDAGLVIQEAQSTRGVMDVDASRLNVKKSDQPMTDTVITAKVKGKFIGQELFGKKDIAVISIHVTTKDGVVYLTGKADNQQQANTAVELAKSVKGVRGVETRVEVQK